MILALGDRLNIVKAVAMGNLASGRRKGAQTTPTSFWVHACTHPSPVAALALRPSGACQTYQSPPQPPGPRRGGRMSALSSPASFNRGLWARLLRVLGS